MKPVFRFALCCLLFFPLHLRAEEFITLASTTSTENSGLYDFLLPKFTEDTGLEVRVVAVGTGQAIKIAENGDADLLLVHHRPSEDAFVEAGYGIERRDVMYNDYVLIGPKANPAGVTTDLTVSEAFQKIAASGASFVSRGDDSGTHKKELELWALSGATPKPPWYLDVGRGMGGALNIAADLNSYILSDRATWISFNNKRELALVLDGDPPLFNPYGVILVNPARHAHVKTDQARVFAEWLTSPIGQSLILQYRVNGEQLFFPYGN